jgi:hypothetical protein
MSIDGLKGKVARLKQARMSPEVAFWIECMNDIEERVIASNLNSKGEQAAQAWGIMQGLSMCKRLDGIYEAELNAAASSQIIKPR